MRIKYISGALSVAVSLVIQKSDVIYYSDVVKNQFSQIQLQALRSQFFAFSHSLSRRFRANLLFASCLSMFSILNVSGSASLAM